MKRFYAFAVALILGPGLAFAADWVNVATISSTLGVNADRICVGEGTRGEIGCPTYAPTIDSAGLLTAPAGVSVTGIVSATYFEGDGSRLTGITGVSTLASLTDVSASLPNIGDVLQWDNGTSKWTAVSQSALISGSQVAFSVHRNGVNQTVTNGGWTTLDWTTEAFDTNDNFDLSTDRFTPTVPGKYLVTVNFHCTDSTTQCNAVINKNGSQIVGAYETGAAGMPRATGLIDMNGITDYLTVSVYQGGGTTIEGNSIYTYFQGALINAVGSDGGGGGATDLGGLTDVTLATPAEGEVLYYNGSNWENALLSGLVSADRLVSGTLSVTANSDTSIVSLSTAGTTWGYLGSAASYLPQLNAAGISATTNQTSVTTLYASGAVGIGTDVPSSTLTVVGDTIISGTAQVAGTGAETCTTGTRGTIRLNPSTGKMQVCRY